jgi:glucose-6-phosphate 1-dehydrogenase
MMVIFGATGDLTKRLLLPSLYNLAKTKLIPEKFAIFGFAFDKLDTAGFRDHIEQSLKEFLGPDIDANIVRWLQERSYYASGDFQDAASYQNLKGVMEKAESEQGTQGNRLFYFAIAPSFIAAVAKRLNEATLSCEEEGGPWRRVIVEKPFGHDLESAKQLNKDLQSVLREDQIYRIDHFLGKETVQNLTVFRFANSIFEPIWNRAHIDHVQITAAETVGVEHRGGYYETAGALRDMMPNHLAQLLSLTAMEAPISFDADSMHSKQAEVLQAIQPIPENDVPSRTVRGQYGAGKLNGADVPAYRSEPGVAPDSGTETYAAMKLMIDNWRWADVPFYLRTGKRMAERFTEITIQFRRAPFVLFRDTPIESFQNNQLLIRIQPDQGITLRFEVKAPGPVTTVESADMSFDFSKDPANLHGTGYERLLHDCMLGDPTLFCRADMVEAGWRMVQPVLDVWQTAKATDFPNYAAGSSGPKAADDLLARDGRHWRKLG